MKVFTKGNFAQHNRFARETSKHDVNYLFKTLNTEWV